MLKIGGFEVDLVPCYALPDASRIRSAVDRTPFHTRFVLSSLDDVKRGQVLLLKQFMKGIGVYGAEAKVQGFSGYLTELLIIKYGDLLNVLRAASGWRPGTVMDMDAEKRSRWTPRGTSLPPCPWTSSACLSMPAASI